MRLNVQVNANHDLFDPLIPTLLSWTHVLREYPLRLPKSIEPDYPCFHIERAQVGFLSIAAWLNGWAVLEEWAVKKSGSGGRNDLWLGRGETQIFFEAKLDKCYLRKGSESVDKEIILGMETARASARCVDSKEKNRVGAFFLVPVIENTEAADFEKFRDLWIAKMGQPEFADAIAFVAHDDNSVVGDGGRIFLGLALLLSKVESNLPQQ